MNPGAAPPLDREWYPAGLAKRDDDEVRRIAGVRPPSRVTTRQAFYLAALPGVDRGRGSWNLLAEGVAGHRHQDPIVRHAARGADRARSHHQVVDTEPAGAEQRPLIDAGGPIVRIADVAGGPRRRCRRALRIDEIENHNRETLGADVLRRVSESGGSETNVARRERVLHGRSPIERCARPAATEEQRKDVVGVPGQDRGRAP